MRLLSTLGALAALLAPAAAQERVQVVATLPDLADLVRAIGGEHVHVDALARPTQNLHAVRVKPSHLVAVSRADLFVQVGLSLEHAWVPGLLSTARNRDILPGTDGFVSAGDGYETIEVPVRTDRALSADVHPAGNPHVNISLDGGPHMAARILEGLVRVDPEHKADYETGHAVWLERYTKKRERWTRIAEAVAELDVAACLYHQEFDYLLGEMGIEIAAFLEPRPGLPPTPAHLAAVVETVRARSIPVVLTASWSNNRYVERVCEHSGAKPLELPIMVEEEGPHATWIGMIDASVDRIARAYGVDPDEAARQPRKEKAEREAVESGAGKGDGGGGV